MRFSKYVIFAFLLIVGVGFTVKNTPPQQQQVALPGNQPEKISTFNILLLGCDISGLRADSIMLVNVNADQGLSLLSLPRDSKMLYEGRSVKLNTLLALTNDDQKEQVIEKLTGTDISYYIKMKVGVFAKIVDALGGLEYTVEKDMHYSDSSQGLSIDLKAGKQTLSGDECEQYCRYRRYVMGDLTRTQNQQKLLAELFSQKMQLKYLPKLPEIYKIVKDNTSTNITPSDVASFLPLFRSLSEKEAEISFYDCPGQYNDMEKEGISFYQIDQKALYNLCQNHFKTQ